MASSSTGGSRAYGAIRQLNQRRPESIEAARGANIYFPVAIAAIFALEVLQFLKLNGAIHIVRTSIPGTLRWACYIGFVLVVLLTGVFREAAFVYFQF